MTDFHVIIPSRLKSKRLPEKALCEIDGLPMIVHVARRCMLSRAKTVTVATCDHRIHWVCKSYEISTVNTSDIHNCGTERLNEACEALEINKDEIIVNVQGDEPFVEPEWVNKVATFMHKNKELSSCIPFQYSEEYNNTNRVKVTTSGNRIIGMSRYDIPYEYYDEIGLKKHLSVLGFRRSILNDFANHGTGQLERIEGIEMMRLLEMGEAIGTFRMDGSSLSVDTIRDLDIARTLMKSDFLKQKYV
ncbi:MAG: 3-deoxy-manno-octulosonate cytidylyltransferase [Paracoccaceae bacterium]